MNKRRHTLEKRRIALFTIAFLGVMGTTCNWAGKNPVLPPTHVDQAPAAKRVSVIPTIEAARKSSASADLEAAKTADSVNKLRTSLVEAYDGLQESLKETDRLRKKGSATEKELMDLYNRLIEQEKQFKDMRHDLAAADASLVSERALRTMVSSDLSEAQKLINDKEAEADQLRGQLEYANKQIAVYVDLSKKNGDAAIKAKEAAANVQGKSDLKNSLLILACLGLVISIVINVILGYILLKP